MSRTVRLSLALLFALMMVIAFAGAALAFNPPDKAPVGVGANNLCETNFPANGDAPGVNPGGGAAGPWHATKTGPAQNPSPGDGPIDFGTEDDNVCVP